MTVDLRNTGVIVQKEFADHLYSHGFRILLGIFIIEGAQYRVNMYYISKIVN